VGSLRKSVYRKVCGLMHTSRCKRRCPEGNFELCAADMRFQTTGTVMHECSLTLRIGRVLSILIVDMYFTLILHTNQLADQTRM
jgi:hypothetical protein